MALRSLDLMIGDWVIFHDSGYASDGTTWKEDRVCQIDSIDEDVRVKWYDENGYKEDWPHVSTGLLSPIPLTPEVLEKNGFKRDPLWHPYDKDLDGYSISVQFGYANRIEYIKIAEKGIDDAIPSEKTKLYLTHINYVHELQHALRLCGIEKEIKLRD